MIDKVYEGLLKAEKYLGKAIVFVTGSMLLAITVIIFIQVICRYGLKSSLSWSEELTKYIMVWLVFLGAGYVLGYNAHSNMDMVVNKFPKKIQLVVKKFNAVLLVFFSYIILNYGWALTMLGRKQKSSALLIPMNYVYLAIPIGGFIMLFYSLLLLLERSEKKL